MILLCHLCLLQYIACLVVQITRETESGDDLTPIAYSESPNWQMIRIFLGMVGSYC